MLSTALLLTLATIAACKTDTAPTCAISAVIVSPSTGSTVPGGTVQLTAGISATNCSPPPTATWSSSAPGVASVGGSGLVTGLAPGNATITALAGTVSGTAAITVAPAPVATIEISPAASTISVGESRTLAAVTKDAQGNTLTGRAVTWTSLLPTIASITQAGVVTGLTQGTGTITATAEGRTAVHVVTVNPPPVATVNLVLNSGTLNPGQSTQAIALLVDAQGNPLSGRTVAFESSNGTVASVTQSGTVTANAVGTATITARSEGKSGSAVITVEQVPVASVSMAVPRASMRVSDSQTATAQARDANGAELTGRTITWATSNAVVATVSQAGVINATAVGVVAITASAGGQFSTVAINVTGAVQSVTVTLSPSTVTAGQPAQAAAVSRDGSGALVPDAVIFTSSNQAVATIAPSGLITTLSAGTSTIRATSTTTPAVSGVAVLTVNPVAAAVASVTLTPATASIVTGGTSQLTATPKDAGGNPLAGRLVSFQSSNSLIASVSTSGLVTAAAVGTATITATVEGVSATSLITVTLVPIATVTVNTPSTTISVGNSVQATAEAFDGAGAPLTGRTFAWSSNALSVAVVSNTGQVTGISAGTATITAAAEGKSGSRVITVVGNPTLTVQSISPANAATGISIESTITITLSENINAATVTAATVVLSKGGVQQAASRTVNLKTITITPTALLTEFNSSYTVTVSTAVKSVVGNNLAAGFTSSFTNVFWDPNYYYRLTNDYRGPGESLDTFSGGSYQCFMGTTGGFTGQFWYFLPIGTSGWYTMQNLFGTPSRGLEGADSPTACYLGGPLIPGQFTGMMWKAVPAVVGRYYLQNLNFGAAKSLDTPLLNGFPHPTMQATGAFTGQFWSFTRLFRR